MDDAGQADPQQASTSPSPAAVPVPVPVPLPSLPSELHALIILHAWHLYPLSTATATLSSLSLVSREFRSIALPKLVRCVNLDDGGQSQSQTPSQQSVSSAGARPRARTRVKARKFWKMIEKDPSRWWEVRGIFFGMRGGHLEDPVALPVAGPSGQRNHAVLNGGGHTSRRTVSATSLSPADPLPPLLPALSSLGSGSMKWAEAFGLVRRPPPPPPRPTSPGEILDMPNSWRRGKIKAGGGGSSREGDGVAVAQGEMMSGMKDSVQIGERDLEIEAIRNGAIEGAAAQGDQDVSLEEEEQQEDFSPLSFPFGLGPDPSHLTEVAWYEPGYVGGLLNGHHYSTRPVGQWCDAVEEVQDRWRKAERARCCEDVDLGRGPIEIWGQPSRRRGEQSHRQQQISDLASSSQSQSQGQARRDYVPLTNVNGQGQGGRLHAGDEVATASSGPQDLDLDDVWAAAERFATPSTSSAVTSNSQASGSSSKTVQSLSPATSRAKAPPSLSFAEQEEAWSMPRHLRGLPRRLPYHYRLITGGLDPSLPKLLQAMPTLQYLEITLYAGTLLDHDLLEHQLRLLLDPDRLPLLRSLKLYTAAAASSVACTSARSGATFSTTAAISRLTFERTVRLAVERVGDVRCTCQVVPSGRTFGSASGTGVYAGTRRGVGSSLGGTAWLTGRRSGGIGGAGGVGGGGGGIVPGPGSPVNVRDAAAATGGTSSEEEGSARDVKDEVRESWLRAIDGGGGGGGGDGDDTIGGLSMDDLFAGDLMKQTTTNLQRHQPFGPAPSTTAAMPNLHNGEPAGMVYGRPWINGWLARDTEGSNAPIEE